MNAIVGFSGLLEKSIHDEKKSLDYIKKDQGFQRYSADDHQSGSGNGPYRKWKDHSKFGKCKYP